ncbi:MAG: hypothetical protein WCY36_06305 [Candidatus Omnitrophota bacterium]
MPIRKALLPIILITIFLCHSPLCHAKNNPPPTSKASTIDELKKELRKDMREEYLIDKTLAQDDYLDRMDKIDNKYKTELDRLWGLIRNVGVVVGILAGLAAIVSFIGAFISITGIKKYFTVQNQLTQTINLFNIMDKGIHEKEKEINLKYDEIIGKKKDYSSLDKANFLDYEHKLYFASVYLPITKNIEDYKKSLFLLGEYWLERGKCGRALLRFRELERIHNELNTHDNIVMKAIRAITKDDSIKIQGVRAGSFYNLYGYAYNACAEQEKNNKTKEELLQETLTNYKKAININPSYSSPYYNIGRFYSVNLKKDREGLKWYGQVFGKEPDLSKETYCNITCCLIRLDEPVSVLIKNLDNIADNDPYWQTIIDDEVINPKIKTTPELRSFILKKFPEAKNIT